MANYLKGMDAPLGSARDGSEDNPRFVWLMAAILFGVGGAIGSLSLVVPHPASFDDGALWTNIGLSFAGALGCVIASTRLPVWPVHVFIAVGIVAVTRAAYYSGDPEGFYSLFYVWIGLFAVFFFSRFVAIAYLGAIGAGYAWLLWEFDVSAGVARWITTIGTIALGVFLIDTLVRRLRSMAADSAELAHERAELLTTLAEVARTDDLTGLPNRRAWDEALEREIARAERDGTPLCLGLADLDRFKLYNDDHGHQAGDRLLKHVAALWGEELRATDVLARYGGEEFALALPGCDMADGAALAERLRKAMPEEQTCSVGLVVWDGEESAEQLFGRADKALYEAKETGRDKVVLAG